MLVYGNIMGVLVYGDFSAVCECGGVHISRTLRAIWLLVHQ